MFDVLRVLCYVLRVRDSHGVVPHPPCCNDLFPSHQPSSSHIGNPTDKAPKDHRGSKSSHKELGNLVLSKSIIAVECVNVWSLEPVTEGCHQIHKKILFQKTGVYLFPRRGQGTLIGWRRLCLLGTLVVITRTVCGRTTEGQKRQIPQTREFVFACTRSFQQHNRQSR